VHLTFVLDEDKTRVLSRLNFKPNYEGEAPPRSRWTVRACVAAVLCTHHTILTEGFAITK
jgi:hypothetical protein